MSGNLAAERPAVTVVTVTYNDMTGLRRTVDSLHQQTFRGFQHVVIDGGSTDGSVAWVKAHPACGQGLVISEPDKGIYDAMNKGLAHAEGVLVTFLNAGDNYADPNVLLRVVEHQRRHGWEWGHGRARIVDELGQVRPLSAVKYTWSRHAFGRNDIVHQTVFVKTDLLRSLGGFDLTYPIAADFHCLLQLGRRSLPGLWADADVDFRVGGLSDRLFKKALWDMHRARCDVLRWRTPLRSLDTLWCGVLILYVQARQLVKRTARCVGGRQAIDWWAARGRQTRTGEDA